MPKPKLHTDLREPIKKILTLIFLNPPLDNIKMSDVSKQIDWQADQLLTLIKMERREAYDQAVKNMPRCLSTCQTCEEARRYFNQTHNQLMSLTNNNSSK